jgi:hypothetical protein
MFVGLGPFIHEEVCPGPLFIMQRIEEAPRARPALEATPALFIQFSREALVRLTQVDM